MTRILVIEDDDGVRENVLELLQLEGFDAIAAAGGQSGVELALRHEPDLIICDVAMPGVDGFEVFEVLSSNPETAVIPFIFLSARAARSDVRRGMTLGAEDYITKPFARVELLDSIRTRLRRSSKADISQRPAKTSNGSAVVASPVMRRLFDQVALAAQSIISVLILGETGVGKEVVAQEVHRLSGRAGPFLALNCAALAESLLESELFGHEKGAFTGAVQAKPGLFESAEGGTLFLDEVGDLSASTQAKLLRVLEDRQVLRVGGRKSRAIDVRFVAATNRDLERNTRAYGFRRDLYYRLAGLTLNVPPLRERPEDVRPLAELFLTKAAPGQRTADPIELTDEAFSALGQYRWPGNIRELRNVIERAVLLCENGRVGLEHLPSSLTVRGQGESTAATDPRTPLLSRLRDVERQRVIDALEQCQSNQTRAAALLGISRRTLVTRLDQYDLPRPRKKTASIPD